MLNIRILFDLEPARFIMMGFEAMSVPGRRLAPGNDKTENVEGIPGSELEELSDEFYSFHVNEMSSDAGPPDNLLDLIVGE